MAIYSASEATTAVIAYETSIQQATETELVQAYQWVFDKIQVAANGGAVHADVLITRATYAALVDLLTTNGYTLTIQTPAQANNFISNFPSDGILPTDNLRKYLVRISWPEAFYTEPVYPTIQGISPTQVSGQQNHLFSARFIVDGGVAPYTFTVDGNIPAGTSWSSLTEVSSITLSGVPTTVADEYDMLLITATDSIGQVYSQYVNWSVTSLIANIAVNIDTSQPAGTNSITYANNIITFYPYELPKATTSSLGGVKPDGTTITATDGVISATYSLPTASTTIKGGVKIDGTTITINNGTISAPYTYTLPAATTGSLGGVKPDGTSISINGSGTISFVTASLDTRIRTIALATSVALY